MTRSGRCLCGKIQYAFEGDPLVVAVCHCKHCQRQSGSAFSIVAVIARKVLTLNGTPKTYNDTSECGNSLERQFCGECGSALFSISPASPNTTIVKAGTLDDTSWLDPKVHVWCSSAQPWVEIDPDAIKFSENAPTS